MKVHSNGYVVVSATDVAAWRRFAVDVLGMMVGRHDDTDHLWLRVDERCQRVIIEAAESDAINAIGWELRNDLELEELIADLDAHGIAHERVDGLADKRGVADLIQVRDPAGYVLEFYWGMQVEDSPFASPAGVSGFVTGSAGLGHVVLAAHPFDDSDRFYRRILGFALTDFASMDGIRAHFLHTNQRHHSLALIDAPKDAWFVQGGLIHFMVQMNTVTDVGRALARAEAAGCTFFETLGEHSNDRMVSFYVNSPAGFPIEVGAGAIEVDPQNWTAVNIPFPDIWGHQVLGGDQ